MIAAYQSRPFPQILEEDEKLDMTIECKRLSIELGDRVFLTCIFPEKLSTNT